MELCLEGQASGRCVEGWEGLGCRHGQSGQQDPHLLCEATMTPGHTGILMAQLPLYPPISREENLS